MFISRVNYALLIVYMYIIICGGIYFVGYIETDSPAVSDAIYSSVEAESIPSQSTKGLRMPYYCNIWYW